MKRKLIIIIFILLCFCIPVQAFWSTNTNVRSDIDFDGDSIYEIIIETGHGAGSNHYIEDLRIYKDIYPELKLIFNIRTLDKTWGFEGDLVEYNADIVSKVNFTEANPDTGYKGIIVESKKIYYKDPDFDHKDIDIVREEDLGTKVYKWDGEKFVE